jgi:nicotinamide mononucleotide (NMN) deamidase PncC
VIANVTANDMVNGVLQHYSGNTTIAISGTQPTGITLNQQQALSVAAVGTTPGTYSVVYGV